MNNDELLLLEITKDFTHSYRDPLWRDILLDDKLKRVTQTKAFQKLDRIKQNGPALLAYPGAVHTRLNHSLGVYHIGRKILISLLRAGNTPFTRVGVRSFLISCLLHDIGHFPYAHSLKELSLKEHEELAHLIIKKDKELNSAIKAAGADDDIVSAIIDKSLPADSETIIYRNILSGALDPDKLDYLNRDAFFSGVVYGNQNNGYIISHLHLIDNRLVLDSDALSNVEHILFSKYLMYKNVYWQKDVRSATSMIKKALLSALQDEIIRPEKLYYLDDYDFDALADNYSYGPFELITRVRNNKLLKRVYEIEWDTDSKLKELSADINSRFMVENRIYSALSKIYKDLKEYEIIIDIPEPISFEVDINILLPDSTIKPFKEVTKLFTKDVVHRFSSALRYIAIYAPQYVDKIVIKEIIEDGRY